MKRKILLFLLIMSVLMLLSGFGLQPQKEYVGNGFSFRLSADYRLIENGLQNNYFVFSGPSGTLKVFTEKLKKNVSPQTYIAYSNYQLYSGKAGFKTITHSTKKINGYQIRQITYCRPVITNLVNDCNYYVETHVINGKKERVVTFWAKSTQTFHNRIIADIEAAIGTFTEKEIISKPSLISLAPVFSPHISYTGRNMILDIPPGQLLWGRFFPVNPLSQHSFENMLNNEAALEHKFEFLMTYYEFPGASPFPKESISKIYQDGRVLMLTLQPFRKGSDWIAVPEIIAGLHDHKIREWAEGLKELGEPVFVRPFNEMNGDWDPWCSWFYGKDNELYILAWRHVVDIFRAAGAENVLFVWNPHDRSYPDFTWNNPHLYYPGDEYVDWIGLTGYNNGTSHPADIWRNFDDIYIPLYNDYLFRYPHKPFMITEFSCNEIGGSKAVWIKEAMESLAKNYPNIKIATWFDSQDNDWLYQLDSSPESFEAFKNGLAGIKALKNSVQIK